MILSIPPKYAVLNFMGFLKGKTSINLFHRYEKFGKRYWGRHSWSRGYCVSSVGLDKEMIRKYVMYQEERLVQKPYRPDRLLKMLKEM